MNFQSFAIILLAVCRTATAIRHYRFNVTQSLLTWEEARQNCLAAGGDLASILSAQDQSKINNLTESKPYYWIGLNDRAVEGTFVWSDGSALGFTNWNFAQPDDGGGSEDCAHVNFPTHGEWNDLPCSLKIKSICKIPDSDPCKNHFEDTIWQRSTGFEITQGSPSRSDEKMTNGWYRFKSKAGGTIPSSCPAKYSCGTEGPIWAEGQLPTAIGNETILWAHGHLNNNCKLDSWMISAKKCFENGETFYIYYLRRPSYPSSYCAGTEIPCKPGLNSPNGFTPGCNRSFPAITSQPEVSFEVTNTDGKEDVEFKCTFTCDDNSSDSNYEISWFFKTPPQFLYKTVVVGSDKKEAKKNLADLVKLNFRLGNTLFCRVQSWYSYSKNRKSRPFDSNLTYAGFMVNQSHGFFSLSEKSKPIEIKLTATIPVLCGKFEKVSLELAEKKAKFSGCVLEFKNGTKEVTFKVAVLKDREMKRGIYQALVTLNMKKGMDEARPNDMPEVWFKHAPIPPVKVMVSDVPFAQCTSTGDPHISTFDKAYYHHYQVGDYVLVNSTARRFEVHVRTWQCASVSCNCGLAAREGDDVIVIDMCRDRIPKVFLPSNKEVDKPGARIRRDKNGKRFIIDFPSGANIKFDTYHWYNDWYYGNVEVNVPSDDYENTVGLCGTFDGQKRNELTDRSGINRGIGLPDWAIGPTIFTESWRLNAGESLFYYKPQREKCKSKRNPVFCTCEHPIHEGGGFRAECNIESLAKKGTNDKPNYKDVKFPGSVHCGRRRRRSTEDAIVMPEDDGLFDYVYNPAPLNITIPKWPTKTGKTMVEVTRNCNKTIMTSIAAKACKKIESFNFDLYVDQCIEDVKIADDYAFASSAVKAMMSACEDELLSNISYWKADPSGNGTLAPPVEIMEIQCPGLCSGRGQCVNATCSCDPGFTSDDCSINVTKGATFRSIPNGGMCDIRKRSDCQKIRATGGDFIDSNNLTCRVNEVEIPSMNIKGKTRYTNGYLLSFAEIMCEMKTNPVKPSGDPRFGKGIPFAGFMVAVSNDRIHYSKQSHLYRIFDSKCIKCSPNGTCEQKNDTCLINGFCFASGEVNPYVSCLRCVPSENGTTFTEVRTGICKPTTTQQATTKKATSTERITTTTTTTNSNATGTHQSTLSTISNYSRNGNNSSSAQTGPAIINSTSAILPTSAGKSTRKPDNNIPDKGQSKTKIVIIVSASVGGIIFLVLVAIIFCKIKKCATQNTKRYPVVNVNSNEVFELGDAPNYQNKVQ